MTRQFSRPVQLDNATFDYFIGGADPAAQQQLAQATAWALLSRVRGGQDPQIVTKVLQHAAQNGVDDMAQVWERAYPLSLAGVLWRLYLVRRAVTVNAAEITQMFRAGKSENSVEVAVAGVVDPESPAAITAVCEQILRGVFAGDFGAALDRAWGFCRVLAVGAARLADERDLDNSEHALLLTKRGARYQQIAGELQAAAKLWRAGKLD